MCKGCKNPLHIASLAQWLEFSAVNRKVTGSIPVGSVILIFITCASQSNKTCKKTTLKYIKHMYIIAICPQLQPMWKSGWKSPNPVSGNGFYAAAATAASPNAWT